MVMTVEAVTKGISRDEWLKLRQKGIGGSDAGAVAELNPWKSKMQIFLEKTGQIEQPEAGEAAEWGQRLEDVVAKAFAKKTGLKVQRSNKLYIHPKHPFMIGNVDRLVTDENKRRGVLECKTASAWLADEWEGETFPEHYLIQLQHYLAVLGVDYGFFAVLIGGNTFRYKYVERNENIIKYLIQLESQFWNEHVLTGIPPSMDGSEASTDLLNQLYPASKPNTSIVLPSEAGDVIQNLRRAQEKVKAAEAELDACKNQVKAWMEDSETAYYNDEKVFTWKTAERTNLDSKALKAKHPDIYEQFAKTTQYRSFLVK